MRSVPLPRACAAALVLVLAACSAEVPPPVVAAPKLPAGIVVAAAPEGARGVGEVKASAKEGDAVVVRGIVSGDVNPIVHGRAVFMLGDEVKLHLCTEMEGDACPTPWDACCATVESLQANTLTVQVVGADGKPLAANVEADGVRPLATIVVQGKAGPRPDPKVLVIDAAAIHVEAGPEKYLKKE